MIQGTSTADAKRKVKGTNNTIIAEFSLAVGNGTDGKTIFANCKAFGTVANYSAQIRKGVSVFVIGTLERRKYNANTKQSLKLNASNKAEYEAFDGKEYKELIASYVGICDSRLGAGTPQVASTGISEDEKMPWE